MYSLPYNPGVGFLNGRLLIADVMNTVSPQTIGDDHPCPATGTAHFTCSVVLHRSGIVAPGATPLISCPRNPGHVSSGFGAADRLVVATHNSVAAKQIRIPLLDYRLSTIGYRLSAIGYRLSAIGRRTSDVGRRTSDTSLLPKPNRIMPGDDAAF